MSNPAPWEGPPPPSLGAIPGQVTPGAARASVRSALDIPRQLGRERGWRNCAGDRLVLVLTHGWITYGWKVVCDLHRRLTGVRRHQGWQHIHAVIICSGIFFFSKCILENKPSSPTHFLCPQRGDTRKDSWQKEKGTHCFTMNKSKHLLSTYYVPNSFYILSQLIPQQPHAAGIMIIHTTDKETKVLRAQVQ